MSETLPNPLNGSEPDDAPEDGEALCLSGGGYRAMLFHLGVLWRLEQAGILSRVKRVSSVSGGSITAARLAMCWHRVQPGTPGALNRLIEQVVVPVRALAGRTLDADAIVGGIFLPGSIGDRVAAAYRKALFGDATLQDLPDAPRFVINATNVQSGVLWRFSKPYMGDWRVGRVPHPDLSLATAVAASSAFPPVLSPIEIDLAPGAITPDKTADLQRPPFTTQVVLTDGGVYDNMGLETAWKRYRTLFVSDGGARLNSEEEPKTDWPRHAYRVLDVIDNQVRALRKRAIVAAFRAGADAPGGRDGAYWGIGTPFERYAGRAPGLACPPAAVAELAGVPTRLKRLDDRTQDRLINWGYAICDAAVRSHVDPTLSQPTAFPYPATGV